MTAETVTIRTAEPTARRRHWLKVLLGAVTAYMVVAYLLLPFAWEFYARRHPAFDDHPRITETSDGHPGDPLNVSLIGTQEQLTAVMTAAGWYPAAALGLKSDLEFAADTMFSRPDDEAPVSRLYLFGRVEDLAFEQPVGNNPRQRHHVRFWKTESRGPDGRPIWIGSASYDQRVGLSHTTGQITHHIAPDLDTERDHLFHDLSTTGELTEVSAVAGFHQQLTGRNGGGDPWHTDGQLLVGVIRASVK